MDTTIKVDSEIRDRLAVLARERGMTMRDLIAELAQASPTEAERRARVEQVTEHLRTRLGVDLDESDIAAGDQLWREVEAQVTSAHGSTSRQGRAA